MSGLMEWLCDVRRIPFYIGIRIVRATVAPFVYMAGAILVKWFVIGRFEAGPRDTTSEWELLRHWLAMKLFSRENIQNVTELLGRHYELVSVLYRMLGAKVGKRVFWPGHQPITTGEFDLLEIGDDVVFGSRSALFFTTTDSCERITLCAGSNVSDNSCCSAGKHSGQKCCIGIELSVSRGLVSTRRKRVAWLPWRRAHDAGEGSRSRSWRPHACLRSEDRAAGDGRRRFND